MKSRDETVQVWTWAKCEPDCGGPPCLDGTLENRGGAAPQAEEPLLLSAAGQLYPAQQTSVNIQLQVLSSQGRENKEKTKSKNRKIEL
jgi:hypothetical protein